MPKVQCKMCGGELVLPENAQNGTCEYCGSRVTFPKIVSEHQENLYARAEHFRQINDYDKAVAAYEKLINASPDDAEAYWGLVLCRYGIEYVKDPPTGERIPTCHRVSYDSILADADYLAALENAGSVERGIYEAEAKRIAEIQKGILAISAQEEPFDVFICYKESDDSGKRTRDSVAAQEIYYALTEQGYKVFFARITLEKKLGQQYEPYIFAALNSAQAMLVIGSKPEYFNAVWVRNEWSRFLALMKKDRKKLLIPCYRDMDAYDIPEELSMFQAQDMGRIGFIQDLLHGIAKVAKRGTAAASGAAPAAGGGKNPLLVRAQLFLETGDFAKALDFCEQVLNSEPENGNAYFLQLMAELKLSDEAELVEFKDIAKNKSFKLARRFADAKLAEKLDEILLLSEKIDPKQREEKARVREFLSSCEISSDGKVLLKANRAYGSITIPPGIMTIGKEAFSWSLKLAEVIIPGSVTSVGDDAFSYCSSLYSVTISPGVKEIGARAFKGCTGLAKVTIPDTVTHIHDEAFARCRSLANVHIPQGVRLGKMVFSETPYGGMTVSPAEFSNRSYSSNYYAKKVGSFVSSALSEIFWWIVGAGISIVALYLWRKFTSNSGGL